VGCRGNTGGGPVVDPAAPDTGCVAGVVVAGDDLEGARGGRGKS